jgi:Protein of unknown function (DUF998)
MTITTTCDRTTSVTRSLLGYGIIAGPLYVVVSLVQALTRDGFDLTRHAWSLLSNGGLGWIQITNFVLAGLSVVAFAVGLRRTGRTGTWTPRLIGVYGLGLVSAGVFRADPALGFPPGTPADEATVSWHGILHFASGAVAFGCLIAACFVAARRYAAEGRRGWAAYSRVTGVLFFAGFAAVASGGGSPWSTVAFTVAGLIAWTWISTVAVDLYRRTGH